MMVREPVSTTTASSEGGSLFLGAPCSALFTNENGPTGTSAAGRLLGRRGGMRAYFFAANATMRFIYSAGDGDVSKVGAN